MGLSGFFSKNIQYALNGRLMGILGKKFQISSLMGQLWGFKV